MGVKSGGGGEVGAIVRQVQQRRAHALDQLTNTDHLVSGESVHLVSRDRPHCLDIDPTLVSDPIRWEPLFERRIQSKLRQRADP